MIKQVKRNNPKGVVLMPNHFNLLSGAGKVIVSVPPTLIGKVNNSGTCYKAARMEKLIKQRKTKQAKRAAWRKRQALKKAA